MNDDIIGPTGDKRRALDTFREHVYSNWRSGNVGPCNDCTAHCLDKGGHPEFGALSPNAKIMWVNNTPGFSGKGAPKNRARPYNQPPKENPTPIQDIPESIDDVYSASDIGSSHLYSYKLDQDWPRGGGYSFWPIHKVLDAPNGTRLEATIEDFYYTNSLKCSKYDNPKIDHDARIDCGSYLRYEIEEFVNPKVVVTGGPEATVSVLASLDIQLNVPNEESDVSIKHRGKRYSVPKITRLVGNSRDNQVAHEDVYGDPRSEEFLCAGYGTNPVIIPMFQFDNCFSNWKRATWDPACYEDYFEQVVIRINAELAYASS